MIGGDAWWWCAIGGDGWWLVMMNGNQQRWVVMVVKWPTMAGGEKGDGVWWTRHTDRVKVNNEYNLQTILWKSTHNDYYDS